MPSPGEDIQSWSTVAANNGTADPLIVWSEGQARASVNNSSRGEMAAIAKWRNLLNGSIVTTGSANAQQFLSGLTYTTIPTNLVVRLKIGAGLDNDGSATLNMDGIGNTLIKTADGENLRGGELIAGSYTDLLYDGSTWIFLYSREFIDDQLHGGGGVIIGTQVLWTAGGGTQSYVPTPGMEACIIECVGGGGGGGGALTANALEYMVGGGGGSGAYTRVTKTAADIGASQLVTLGAGGAGGVGAATGSAGGNTSVGSLCVALGGSGGQGAQNGAVPVGGAGGDAGTVAAGEIHCQGTAGETGTHNSNTAAGTFIYGSGAGASSVFGGGPTPMGSTIAHGSNAGNYGGGGHGGSLYGGPNIANGGAGSPGIVIITEFAGRGAPGHDGAIGPMGPVGPSGSGTGDVLRGGVPSAGQIAVWADASHIQGVNIGDYQESTGTLASFGSGGWFPPVNITLGPGDWDVSATSMFVTPSAPSGWWSFISEVTGNPTIGSSAAPYGIQTACPPVGSLKFALTIPPARFSLGSSTTVYLQVFQNSGISLDWSGSIHARRVR